MATTVVQKVTVRRTKTRMKKNEVKKGYRPCNMCHGTGKIKTTKKRGKKS